MSNSLGAVRIAQNMRGSATYLRQVPQTRLEGKIGKACAEAILPEGTILGFGMNAGGS
jgi:hypothetical protein